MGTEETSPPLWQRAGEVGATNPAASLQPGMGENAERQWESGMLHGKQLGWSKQESRKWGTEGGISEEQEELVTEAVHGVPAETISMRDSSMARMPRANFFSLWIPDPAHRKARKETCPGWSLKKLLTEVDPSSDPVSHYSLSLCSFLSTVAAKHVECVNKGSPHLQELPANTGHPGKSQACVVWTV